MMRPVRVGKVINNYQSIYVAAIESTVYTSILV